MPESGGWGMARDDVDAGRLVHSGGRAEGRLGAWDDSASGETIGGCGETRGVAARVAWNYRRLR